MRVNVINAWQHGALSSVNTVSHGGGREEPVAVLSPCGWSDSDGGPKKKIEFNAVGQKRAASSSPETQMTPVTRPRRTEAHKTGYTARKDTIENVLFKRMNVHLSAIQMQKTPHLTVTI